MNQAPDPILLEVVNNALTTIGAEMANTMRRTARSMQARTGDFSTVLVDARGRVIAQGVGAGFHLGYLRSVMPWVLRKFGASLREGDVIATNDPYGGLSHLPDIVLLEPIFWQQRLVGFATLVTHHSDVGGRFPGGQGTLCAEIFEEGLRLPGVKLYEQGRRNQALFDVIAANVRTPDDVVGDVEGQAAACRRGARGMLELIAQYGVETFEACIEQLQRYSERLTRAAIARIPDGDYGWDEHFEEDGLGGPGINLKLNLKVRGDRVTADFTGSDRQVKSAINVPFSLTCTAAFLAFRSMLVERAPDNDGLFAPIEVIAPLGSVLNPRFPAAVGGRGMMLWRLLDMIFGALAKAIPERIFAASDGGASAMIYIPQRDDGSASVMLDWYQGGWGARPTMDGIEGASAMAGGAGGGGHSVERMEREFPMLVEAYGFAPDTGGAGKYRGALSYYRKYRFLCDGRALIRTCRSSSLPYGLAGGNDGTPFRAVQVSNGREIELPCNMFIDTPVKAGETIMHMLPGAGGYGPALQRDPDRVADDVLDEKISAAYARRVYGVVVDRSGRADLDATGALRQSIRERGASAGERS